MNFKCGFRLHLIILDILKFLILFMLTIILSESSNLINYCFVKTYLCINKSQTEQFAISLYLLVLNKISRILIISILVIDQKNFFPDVRTEKGNILSNTLSVFVHFCSIVSKICPSLFKEILHNVLKYKHDTFVYLTDM